VRARRQVNLARSWRGLGMSAARPLRRLLSVHSSNVSTETWRRAEDDTHATLTTLFDDFVMEESLADHSGLPRQTARVKRTNVFRIFPELMLEARHRDGSTVCGLASGWASRWNSP